MLRRLFTTCALALLPALAIASGGDILMTIYAELLTVAVVVLALRLVPSFRPSTFGGVAFCILGVIGSWFVTSDMPYMANQILITLISVAFPILATAAYLVWRRARGVR